ncbi:hypothetical protein ABZP36_036148 [Zizania latifolia]
MTTKRNWSTYIGFVVAPTPLGQGGGGEDVGDGGAEKMEWILRCWWTLRVATPRGLWLVRQRREKNL